MLAPVAVDDAYLGRPDERLFVPSFLGILVNDENPDQAGPLQAELVTDVEGGALTLNADGSFQYEAQGFAGVTTFEYTAFDGTQRSGPATVTLTINTAPIAVADQYELSEDGALVVSAERGVAANDLDPERTGIDQALVTSLVAGPSHGTLNLETDGSFSYSPDADYVGDDAFEYQVSDGLESSNAQVTLMVTPVNDAPQARGDVYFTSAGSRLDVADTQRGLASNDVDVDSAELTTALVTQPAHGTIVVATDGTFQYDPEPEFIGVDSFTYETSDGSATSAPATVSLFVGTSPIRISEVMAINGNGLVTRTREEADDSFRRGTEQQPDWIELQNLTGAPLNLGGFYLSDNRDVPTKWGFPASAVIPAEGYLIVFASGADIRDGRLDEQGWLHTNFSLSSGGDELSIAADDGTVLDAVDGGLPEQFADIAYGLSSNNAVGYLLEATPGGANGQSYLGVVSDTVFSQDRGFYSEPFTVALSTATQGAEIRFTTDGSPPTATHGQVYAQPIAVSTTTNLRAAAFLQGYVPTNVDTQTYVFIEDVVRQPAEIAGFPVGGRVWAGQNTFVPQDSEMDPTITNDPAYADDLRKGLTDIPTMSITSDGAAIFGDDGWYDGEDVETAVSVELIYPNDPGRSQQANAGIESHSHDRLKRSLRLNFRGEYGDSQLTTDLFDQPWTGNSAVDSVNRIVLRGGNNRSWARIWNPDKTAYTIDEFARANQIAMSGYGMRGSYVHLYINGVYWGLYNPVERSDEFFTSSYFGGDPDDWFAVNHGGDLSGNDDRFDFLTRELRRSDMTEPANYEQAQSYLDVEGFADYLLLSWWSAVSDWPQNNWYGGNRNDSSEFGPTPFQYFVWDSEWSWGQGGQSSSDGRSQVHGDFVSRRSGGTGIAGLWHALRVNDDFLTMFGDRVHKHLANGGALSEDVAKARWTQLTDYVRDAVVAESARWGDSLEAANSPTRTRDGDWQSEVDRILSLLTGNNESMILDLRREGYYPAIDAPTLSQFGGSVPVGFELSLQNPNASGTVYYTLDGSDPRAPGGALAATAMAWVDGQTIALADRAQVRARVLDGEVWSAISDASFTTTDTTALRITEVMYNPTAPTQAEIDLGFLDNDDFEFIEVQNVGSVPLNLAGLTFTAGIDYTFANQSLDPNQVAVIAKSARAMAARYGEEVAIAGQFTRGSLANGGELIEVSDSIGNVVLQLEYDDGGSWPVRADGFGASIILTDPAETASSDIGSPSRWAGSSVASGTPGVVTTQTDGVVISEVLTNTDGITATDSIELYNRSDDAVSIGGWYLSDSATNLKKYVIPQDTVLQPKQRIVFSEPQFNAPDATTPFALSGENGDDVWLTAADESGAVSMFIDDVHFVAAPTGQALGRVPDASGRLVPLAFPSLGAANGQASVGAVVISELHYRGESPTAEAIAIDPTIESRDLEFVEIVNTSDAPVPLDGWRMRGGVDYDFRSDNVLAPGSVSLLISFNPNSPDNAMRAAAFRSHYGLSEEISLMGGYQGQLSDKGERVRLLRAETVNADPPTTVAYYLEDETHYESFAPWPVSLDAAASLNRISAAIVGNDSMAWTALPASPGAADLLSRLRADFDGSGDLGATDIDRLCAAIHGGGAEDRFDLNLDGRIDQTDFDQILRGFLRTTPGDANLDGQFDSSDLVDAFASGQYEDAVDGNSTWGDGDWNCDGDFTTADLVAAFRFGRYVR